MQNIRMRVQMSFDPRLDRYPACLLLCEEMNGKDLTETKLLRFIKCTNRRKYVLEIHGVIGGHNNQL